MAGTFHFGIGETFDQAKVQTLPAGAFVYMAAKMPHFACMTWCFPVGSSRGDHN